MSDELTQECETRASSPRFEVTRRKLLGAAGAAAGLLAIPGARLSFAGTPGTSSRTLVAIFMRGAADGLSLVPPVGDSAYAKLRPTIAIPASKAISLDRTFGLHPAMKSLMPYYSSGQLAIVHAVGDPDGSRSHFEMQDAVERMADVNASTNSPGWIGKWLKDRKGGPGAFPAVAISGALPVSLQGDAPAMAMSSVDTFNLAVSDSHRALVERTLNRMNSHARADLKDPAILALSTIDKLAPYRGKTYKPANGAVYPTSPLGFALSQVALLLHAKVGLTAVALDAQGWDMHVAMGGVGGGTMTQTAQDLAECLAAFAKDLGSALDDVTLTTMTEFGRTAAENGSSGTDHGVASAMFILGKTPTAFKGGKVHAQWPGLAAAIKDPNVDVAVTTDYRTVLNAVSSTVG